MFVKREKTIAIFDLDGTTVETDAANSAAYLAGLESVGVMVKLGMYGRITSDIIKRGLPEISAGELNEIVRAKIEAYCHELWRTRLGPAADALKCVIMNRASFDKVVLLTQSSERRAMETLRYHGIAGCFDEIVCNGGNGNKYANYFGVYDTDPAACVVWENENEQIKSALVAGVKMENIRKVG